MDPVGPRYGNNAVTWRRTAFAVAAWLYLAGIVVQVFLAGAGLFDLTDWTTHTNLGWVLGTAPLLLLVLAAIARVDRRTVLWTAGLTVAALVQPELAAARHTAPVMAALHPLNALLVFWLALTVARRTAGPAQFKVVLPGAAEPASPADASPVVRSR